MKTLDKALDQFAALTEAEAILKGCAFGGDTRVLVGAALATIDQSKNALRDLMRPEMNKGSDHGGPHYYRHKGELWFWHWAKDEPASFEPRTVEAASVTL